MNKEQLKEIRTENLKKDYQVYLKVRINREALAMTWPQWVAWIHKTKSADKNSVFFGMSFSEYVNV